MDNKKYTLPSLRQDLVDNNLQMKAIIQVCRIYTDFTHFYLTSCSECDWKVYDKSDRSGWRVEKCCKYPNAPKFTNVTVIIFICIETFRTYMHFEDLCWNWKHWMKLEGVGYQLLGKLLKDWTIGQRMMAHQNLQRKWTFIGTNLRKLYKHSGRQTFRPCWKLRRLIGTSWWQLQEKMRFVKEPLPISITGLA